MWEVCRILIPMPVIVPVNGKEVTVSDDGNLTCTCGGGHSCRHITAVLCGDKLMAKPGPLSKALDLIDPHVRIQVLTARLDAEKDHPMERPKVEAAIAALRSNLGR
jgi:uncharacterized Zn finger protein